MKLKPSGEQQQGNIERLSCTKAIRSKCIQVYLNPYERASSKLKNLRSIGFMKSVNAKAPEENASTNNNFILLGFFEGKSPCRFFLVAIDNAGGYQLQIRSK